jgi:hypothetical protein
MSFMPDNIYRNWSFSLAAMYCGQLRAPGVSSPVPELRATTDKASSLGRTQNHHGHYKEDNISCSSQNRANIGLYSSLYTKHYTEWIITVPPIGPSGKKFKQISNFKSNPFNEA